MASSSEASTSRQPPSLIPVAPVQLRSRWRPKAYLDSPQPYPPDVERMNEPDLIPNVCLPKAIQTSNPRSMLRFTMRFKYYAFFSPHKYLVFPSLCGTPRKSGREELWTIMVVLLDGVWYVSNTAICSTTLEHNPLMRSEITATKNSSKPFLHPIPET